MLIVFLILFFSALKVTSYQQPIAWLTNALRPNTWFSTPDFLLLSSSNNGQLKRRNELKTTIYEATSLCQPNGLTATAVQQSVLKDLVNQIERLNPTPNPAYSPLMNGYWRMLYTDFTPAAGNHLHTSLLTSLAHSNHTLLTPSLLTIPSASSGKLGPFVGDVFQDLDATQSLIRNILQIKFPPIDGALIANQRIKDPYTWEIEFDRIENSIFGISLPPKKFTTQEIRLWQIAFLDDELRILRARKPETDSTDSFIFILVREPR